MNTTLRQQDDETFGSFLIETIADLYNVSAYPSLIGREVYRATRCGASVQFDEEGIVVGTIVEDIKAEYSQRIDLSDIEADERGAAILAERFFAAIDACEDFADAILAMVEEEV